MAHIRTILPQRGGVSPVDNNTIALFHFDEHARDSIRGLRTIGHQLSLDFNGTSDYFRTATLPQSNALTISLWFYARQGGQRRLFWGHASNKAIAAVNDNGTLQWYMQPSGGSTGYITTATAVSFNKWNHFALVYDGAKVTSYINGIKDVNEAAITGSSAAGQINFGTNYNINGNWFDGKMAEVGIWGKALSIDEIKQAMNYQCPSDTLFAYYKLNEGTGTILRDYSSYGNDVIPVGTKWSEGQAVYSLVNGGYPGGAGKGAFVEEATTNYFIYPMTQEYYGGILRAAGSYYTTQDYQVTATAQPAGGPLPGCKVAIASGQSFTISGYTSLSSVSIFHKGFDSANAQVYAQTNVSATPDANGYYTKTINVGTQTNLSYINVGVGATGTANYWIDKTQVEVKTYTTSFVNGTRSLANLQYLIPMPSNPFTISFWAKVINYSSTWPWYINMYPSGTTDGSNRIFFRPSGKTSIAGGRVVGGTAYSTSTGTVSDVTNGWHMYAMTSSGTNVNIYQDGILVASGSSITDLPAGTQMLLELYGSNPSFNTVFDELRIDNVARTSTEISAWYYQGRNGW